MLATALFCINVSALADRAWVCSVPATKYTKAALIRLRIEGRHLIAVGKFPENYEIIMDSADGGVASTAVSGTETTSIVKVGASVVVINLTTMGFAMAGVCEPRTDYGYHEVLEGTCIDDGTVSHTHDTKPKG